MRWKDREVFEAVGVTVVLFGGLVTAYFSNGPLALSMLGAGLLLIGIGLALVGFLRDD
jgi:hypothetical protein